MSKKNNFIRIRKMRSNNRIAEILQWLVFTLVQFKVIKMNESSYSERMVNNKYNFYKILFFSINTTFSFKASSANKQLYIVFHIWLPLKSFNSKSYSSYSEGVSLFSNKNKRIRRWVLKWTTPFRQRLEFLTFHYWMSHKYS